MPTRPSAECAPTLFLAAAENKSVAYAALLETAMGNHASSKQAVLANQAAADVWQSRTGVAAAETAFTFALPIHNEERSLPSVLAALCASEIPSEAHITVALMTNACSDSSAAIVQDFLAELGQPYAFDKVPFDVYQDEGIAQPIMAIRSGAFEFVHLDTTTAGKANVLNVGNRLALALGHQVACSQDTNNWIEPDALACLFGDAQRRFFDKPDGTAMIYGHPVALFRDHPGSIYNKMQKRVEGMPVPAEEEKLCLPGWMMIWDTKWLAESGGVPHTATEDFALAVLTRGMGRNIGLSTARIWGYNISTLGDLLEAGKRFVRGELQLVEYWKGNEKMSKQVQTELLHSANFFRRFGDLIARTRKQPLRLPVHLVHWMLWEVAYRQGIADFKANPHSSTWAPISSTK
ncbi:MAG: glycosyltransferase family 2 protein [Planctomycetes bacterium]|jgi:hypothetical protein|nr:glycosyltransferase family 2 protein [Planctomycetota bacterium]MBT4028101.1 glycosyltransferase family 2 protein [Planctomycetota bacterium]MBT4560846.1 glycosyltransferase family 2 protein [Planctomycetota bacterium]MBT5101500.1 glycosyltransferase family 2 protein [Planctomycetota bacterium]MBT5119162.1 glycosyltransferase family 2 protein [Planctomycetota bacterium]